MTTIEPIRNESTFLNASSDIRKSFHVNQSFPKNPFLNFYENFSFEEFDWTLCDEFWTNIQNIALQSGDKYLLMAVLDPDPVRYYKNEFGYYNWSIIPTSASKNEYWKFLNNHPEESPADAIFINSEKIVWLPQSRNWAIWGERSYELCVLGHRKDIEINTWKDINWALESIANCFRNGIVPREFSDSLRKNFRNKIRSL